MSRFLEGFFECFLDAALRQHWHRAGFRTPTQVMSGDSPQGPVRSDGTRDGRMAGPWIGLWLWVCTLPPGLLPDGEPCPPPGVSESLGFPCQVPGSLEQFHVFERCWTQAYWDSIVAQRAEEGECCGLNVCNHRRTLRAACEGTR